MMNEYGLEMTYNDSKCSDSSLLQNTTLNSTCELTRRIDEEDPGTLSTALRSTYTVYFGGKQTYTSSRKDIFC